MRGVLTVGLLVLLLSAWVTPSGAQTQGPGRGEVPSELWKKYPLKEPRAAPLEESGKRQSRNRPKAPAIDQKTDDGARDMSLFVVGGLLLLALSAVLVATATSGGIERLRRKEGAPRGTAPAVQPTANGQRAAPAHDVATAARELPSPAPPRPRPTPASMQSRIAPGRNAHGQATLSRQPALGYASAPAEGDASGSMRRQQREIEAVCGRKDLAMLKFVRDIEAPGGSGLSRPGLAYALERLAAHDASCLVVSSLERLTRSAASLGTLVEWLDRCGARLVVVDIELDTGTPEGRLRAKALAAAGGLERRTLRQRTRTGVEAARPAKTFSGQPSVSDGPALKRRIAEMRASGMTLQAIADALNAEGIPTLRGGIRWRPSSVQAAAGYKRPNYKRPNGKTRFG
jgi:DNA invertase Pin-like site-specific DNA recombinase